ncbi:MAG: hypothetical protein Q8908_16665 [Bacteroidota bacterium]|nr:hypothetical protein [Bacteroidota bacterium]
MSAFTDLLHQSSSEALINSVADMTLQRPGLMEELWEFAITDDPAAWKALWVMDKIHDTRPDLIRPYLKRMLDNVERLKQSGQKRQILKLLSLNPLPADPTGGFIDFCFTLLQSKSEPIAGRVYAMQVLYNISERIPEFKNELRAVIEDAMIEGTPGIKSRGRKLLRNL